MCHDCVSGAEPAAASNRSGIARQKLFSGAFSLTRIEAIWQEPDESYWFSGRWYVLPEETHTGRQVSSLNIVFGISLSIQDLSPRLDQKFLERD